MSNIWNRGSEPSGGIPVAPDEKVGPVLVPADWVLVLSVCDPEVFVGGVGVDVEVDVVEGID